MDRNTEGFYEIITPHLTLVMYSANFRGVQRQIYFRSIMVAISYRVIFVFALSLLPSVAVAQGLGRGNATISVNNEWPRAEADTMGLNMDAIEAHKALCEQTEADGCLVAYRGYIVSEWYGPKYKEPISTMSSMKSWTSLLTGMLIDDGKIEGVDDLVEKYIPEWSAGVEAGVKIRHLLTMTSGLERRRGREGPLRSIGFEADKNGFVLGLPLEFEPGKKWMYSNEGAQLLSPILERAAGVPLQEYAEERLFRAIGMSETELMVDSLGHAWTYADSKTTLRDFARIGQLMLNKGKWNGKEIISERWITESTRPHESPNPHTKYGYLWWIIDDPYRFASMGFRATDCYVLPEVELVIVRMQNSVSAVPPETPYYKEAGALFKQMVPVH